MSNHPKSLRAYLNTLNELVDELSKGSLFSGVYPQSLQEKVLNNWHARISLATVANLFICTDILKHSKEILR
jgi:hypothetical protein